jgi:hypothetical protein
VLCGERGDEGFVPAWPLSWIRSQRDFDVPPAWTGTRSRQAMAVVLVSRRFLDWCEKRQRRL